MPMVGAGRIRSRTSTSHVGCEEASFAEWSPRRAARCDEFGATAVQMMQNLAKFGAQTYSDAVMSALMTSTGTDLRVPPSMMTTIIETITRWPAEPEVC